MVQLNKGIPEAFPSLPLVPLQIYRYVLNTALPLEFH